MQINSQKQKLCDESNYLRTFLKGEFSGKSVMLMCFLKRSTEASQQPLEETRFLAFKENTVCAMDLCIPLSVHLSSNGVGLTAQLVVAPARLEETEFRSNSLCSAAAGHPSVQM